MSADPLRVRCPHGFASTTNHSCGWWRARHRGADLRGGVKPRLLDLFCGAGGCSVGYARAGFDVTGVDIQAHPDYPYPLQVADAIEVLEQVWSGQPHFDAIHASPPCQAYTTMSNRWRGQGGRADGHVELIDVVRDWLTRWEAMTDGVWVIENVPGARKSLRAPVTYSGGAFGLRVNRPRLFESNAALTPPVRVAVSDPLGVYGKSPDGRRLFDRKDGSIQRAARGIDEARDAMGIDWMSWDDLREAVPPAYTEHIGRQLLEHVRRAAA